MFWIEESPTSQGDDDSEVPFDESPGKPMACEQEIELIIRPDDDDYPYKALDADEDTWPETLSAYGGTSTLVSDEVDKESTGNKDSSSNDDSSDQVDNAEDCHSEASSVDDDATQVMGEHHTIEGPEDERTFTTAQDQDEEFVYLAPKVRSEEARIMPANEDSFETNLEEDRSPESSSLTPAEASPEERNQESNILQVEESAKDLQVAEASNMEAAAAAAANSQQQDSAGATIAPAVALVEDADANEDSANGAPALVSEPIEAHADDGGGDDDDENDAASMSAVSETKPLNEMNDEDEEQEQDQFDSESSLSERDWYDQWEPLEETGDGISCITNMFASVIKDSSMMPKEEEDEDGMGELPFSLANPTMMSVFSDGGADEISQFAKCAATIKSEPPSRKACKVVIDAPELQREYSSSSSSSSSGGKMPKQVVLIVEGEDDNGETTPMTLHEYLNLHCQQGSRKERRRRIMERQRSALSRITPVMAATSAPGSTSTGAHGFLDHFLEFDPLAQLQNIWDLAG
ncbi:unnamed protein product [Cylindrotheca closterium]|uniref:Uncharacterized protein n=1 Tax=Cylindrotheca closterium TaxID=2856 RepID=A0AAD2FCB2_9STRA|nr:unnamed protein product [Cylindrotheca closterium]